MEEQKLLKETLQLLLLKYPRFGSNIASSKFEFNEHLKYHTAATDGKKIYVDPNYLKSLNENDRLFLIAHEIMHMKFFHPFRLENNKKKRDPYIWNIATDAIINANLKRDGLMIKEGYVNIPEALYYSADELYERLVTEKQAQNQNENTKNSENSEEFTGSDHTLWEEALEKKNEEMEEGENPEVSSECNETQEFAENREERLQKAKENYEKMKEQILQEKESKSSSVFVGEVGVGKDSIGWETLLRKESEKEEMIWSQRRSIRENNYAYRLEENELEEEAQTEVQIDVSGSVNLNLVKAFLRITKSIFQHSKLKVGCFNERFLGWIEIHSIQDIDCFEIPEGARGSSARTEDWDLAVRSFTKKEEINKVVFTDGIPGPGNMPKEDLKNENIIWVVYGNKKFSPCCGKVIQITEEELKCLHGVDENFLGKTR